MDDKHPEKKPRLKKPYAKPEVKKIHLRPEEAVLGGCKTSSSYGPGQSQCTFPAPCSTNVS